MPNSKQPKPKAKTKRTRKSSTKKGNGIAVKRWVTILSLLGFLLFTLGAVGYVIFFRTVLA